MENDPHLAVLDMLLSQEFKDWYEGSFEDFITGEEGSKDPQEIIEDLRQLLDFTKR